LNIVPVTFTYDDDCLTFASLSEFIRQILYQIIHGFDELSANVCMIKVTEDGILHNAFNIIISDLVESIHITKPILA
jgi:hypothetical protein